MTEQQPEKHLHDAQNLTIGFIGNPNCGKTTLFNAFTGANLKVANWWKRWKGPSGATT